ncbi:hypothetical protein [Micromonospora sp. 4G55]|uniref:hypothetical protein n=1 Tax=Micromonospora sp. 4G55 TaxID=2806102 RepID=UPI001A60F9D0|nr:hypothetical protein [Micromonospora sp. 4G55]MBM0259390.1 hypothetical protein [Micromonospora sp. 4G55]MBM0259627.1 hypothetical protein [Micromonospora sp. 4G55]
MIEGWSVVPERAAVGAAGPNVEVVHGDGVTFAYGANALVVIVDAGDRPHGTAVDNANTLVLREPLPSEATQWIRSKNQANQPLLGFVKMADGCLALGELYQARSIYRGMNPYTGQQGPLTFAELTWGERLPPELLDKVRPTPTPTLPVPGIAWLDDVPQDLTRALRSFLTAWYADVPVLPATPQHAAMKLPAPLLAFHDIAGGREEILGRQDFIEPPDRIEYLEDEPLVAFAAENQGVWVALIDPTDDDPVVWYDGGPQRLRERERLSGFLLQFALNEAVSTSPFTGFATVTTEMLDRFVEDLVPVPLQPMRVPGDPTRHWVAPGLVAMAADYGDSGIWLSVGSRQRSALRPLRSRLDWEQFNG